MWLPSPQLCQNSSPAFLIGKSKVPSKPTSFDLWEVLSIIANVLLHWKHSRKLTTMEVRKHCPSFTVLFTLISCTIFLGFLFSTHLVEVKCSSGTSFNSFFKDSIFFCFLLFVRVLCCFNYDVVQWPDLHFWPYSPFFGSDCFC